MKGLSYSFGASFSPPGKPQGAKMGEAYHDCTVGTKGMEDRAQTGKGYYMKSMSPGADFDASSIEAARKQRIETLRDTVARSEELDSVAQQENGNNTSAQMQEKLREECENELILLRNYVAPRRKAGQRITGMVEPVKLLTPPAASSLPLRMTVEAPNSPEPSRPEDTSSITAAKVWAVMRTGRQRPAPRAFMYDEEAQYNRRTSSSFGAAGKITELKKLDDAGKAEPSSWERRDSALSGLDETQPDVTGENGNAKSPATDERTSFSALTDSLPPPCGDRRALPNEDTPERKNVGGMETERQCVLTGHTQRETAQTEEALLKALVRGERAQQQLDQVLDPVEYAAPPTFAEKGKWPEKCTCLTCRPIRRLPRGMIERVRFVDTAMDKAEEEPGLSHEERMNMERARVWREAAEKRGEGSSSWAKRASMAGLDESMFSHPRPAPRVPVSVGQRKKAAEKGRAQRRWVEVHHKHPKAKEGRLSVFPPARGCNDMFTSRPMPIARAIPRTGNRVVTREAASPVPPVQRGGRSRQIWETLPKPSKWWKSEAERQGNRD